MNLSIVIPLFNEEESLPELHDWIKRVMDENKYSYEILFIHETTTSIASRTTYTITKMSTLATS